VLTGVLRARDGTTPRVTTMELFFDLVYVFAVTQLSHHLLEHLDWEGALQTLVLFVAVWWSWNYTAWATNWIDPDRAKVRGLMVVLMLLSLVFASALPDAFGDEGLRFALPYVAMQVVRPAFMVAAFPPGDPMRRNYAQLLAWSALGGVAWIAGALAEGDNRLALWVLALVIDVGAPAHSFWLPARGGTDMRTWTLVGGHLAERCQLVVIIALGESVLITGAVFGESDHSAAVTAAFAAAFAGSVALWWSYFVGHAERGAHRLEGAAEDSTRLARGAYAYAHAVMVAGVIVAAVGDEEAIAHPNDDLHADVALVILAGPALFLAGIAMFRWTLTGRVPPAPLLGIGLLAVLAAVATVATPLVLSALATLAVAVAVVVDGRVGARSLAPG
jgi:low temperature requirement protein LtrA